MTEKEGKATNGNSQIIYVTNVDLTGNNVVLLSPSLGMVSRLKYIVSNRAQPPSPAGLGYGKSTAILV